MDRRLLRPGVVALVAANLATAAGVLLLGWELAHVMLLYWMESAIVGASTVLRMALTRSLKALFFVPFFLLHFGLFMSVHFVFLMAMFLRDAPAGTWGTVGLGALALLAGHGVSFVQSHVRDGERPPIERLFTAPYPRVVVMQITLIVGGGVMLLLGAPWPALLVLVAMKTAVDVGAHLRERARFAPAA